jgi:hypothetical protein
MDWLAVRAWIVTGLAVALGEPLGVGVSVGPASPELPSDRPPAASVGGDAVTVAPGPGAGWSNSVGLAGTSLRNEAKISWFRSSGLL